MRLNQYLAACGLGSRRQCEDLIAAGRVRINGDAAHFGVRVQAGDRVEVDGQEVRARARGEVWALNKPAGVLVTVRDSFGRATVLDLARAHGIRGRLFPVGRLDLDTTGLLLLTDDGDLAQLLTHPSRGVDKEYEARVREPLAPAELERLRDGIELEEGRTAPCQAWQECGGDGVLVRLVLHEGRKRQVRRMLSALGHPVLHLHRVRIGPLRLGDLPAGELRSLSAAERAALETASGAPATGSEARRAPRPGSGQTQA